MAYVQHLYFQKEMFSEFIKTIIERVKQRPPLQPTAMDIKAAIARLPGLIVTYQAFKICSPRYLRSVQKQEYDQCLTSLTDFGIIAVIAFHVVPGDCGSLSQKRLTPFWSSHGMRPAPGKNIPTDSLNHLMRLSPEIFKTQLSQRDISPERTLLEH